MMDWPTNNSTQEVALTDDDTGICSIQTEANVKILPGWRIFEKADETLWTMNV